MAAPASPKLYHITHVDNLAAIIAAGGLRSDARMRADGGPSVSIGMPHLKERRLSMPVRCHGGDVVGDYVPFYFCPRSIMLYLIYRANHEQLAFKGGQGEIVHLELDLRAVAQEALHTGGRFAFTRSNASAWYTDYTADLAALDDLDWASIGNTDFRDRAVKEAKQAEFLVHDIVPWRLVERIGAQSRKVAEQVEALVAGAPWMPKVELRHDWYY